RASPPKRAARRRAGATASNAERLAAAATITLVGIVESKTLVQTVANEIELGAVDKRQALGVDDDLHPMYLERLVIGVDLVGILQLVRQAGAAGGAHPEAQRDTSAAPGQALGHALRGPFGHRHCHRE